MLARGRKPNVMSLVTHKARCGVGHRGRAAPRPAVPVVSFESAVQRFDLRSRPHACLVFCGALLSFLSTRPSVWPYVCLFVCLQSLSSPTHPLKWIGAVVWCHCAAQQIMLPASFLQRLSETPEAQKGMEGRGDGVHANAWTTTHTTTGWQLNEVFW